jgi:hypothetical protein
MSDCGLRIADCGLGGVDRVVGRARLLMCWCVVVLMCWCVAGCAHHKPKPPPTSAGERGPAVGIDLCWFIVDDDPFDDNLKTGEARRAFPANSRPLAEVMSEYANRVIPVTPATRALWRANGLRLISVPRREFDRVKDSLRLVGAVQQQQVGESARWLDVAPSPSWADNESVMMDDGPVTLGPGRLRVLLRCWAAPASTLANAEISADPARRLETGAVAGAIQLEMVPQHVGKASREDIAALLKPKPRIEDEGVMFSRLLLEASLTNDDLLLVVPERPDAEWRPQGGVASDAPGAHPMGPAVPSAPTLGELMLTDQASGGHRNARMVLVIAPSPPRRFNLLAQK